MKNPSAAAQIVPPNSVESEQATLASMLIEAAAIEIAASVITASDFYRPEHQVIFEIIIEMTARRVPVDLTTFRAELQTRGKMDAAGGLVYITALFDNLPTAANVLHYAEIVYDKSVLRSMQLTYDLHSRALVTNAGDVDKLLQSAQRDICALGQRHHGNDLQPLSRFVGKVYSEAEDNGEAGGRPVGLQTGFHDFDERTGGLAQTDLIIIAARPSMGKSAMVLSIADHVARCERKPVAFFSLEMSSDQVAARLMCSRAGIDSNTLRCGKLKAPEWERLSEACHDLYTSPFRIDDGLDSGILGMRSKCRRMMADGGLGLIVVDYLQLMAPEGRQENRNQEVAKISRELKAMARELRVPVVALSQLSRQVETRADKRPMLSDLRDSGAIEQDADVIVFLYNDAYYNRATTYAYNEQGGAAVETVEAIVAKNRNGWTGVVKLGFVRPFARFQNLDERF